MKILSANSKFILILGASLLGLVMTFGHASTANAQAAAKAARPTQQEEKKKSLSFEDELVEGATAKPELFYLFQKKNFNYKRLIRLRENFIPEMRRTSEDVQRGRGSN